jgi:release factor glutamine methyltransferase
MTNKVTVREALRRASSLMESLTDGRFLAEMLIRHVLGVDRTHFLMQLNDELSSEQWEKIEDLVKQRVSGIPVQYLMGEQEFYGLPFHVNASVLIPRPDTEVLVEEVLRHRNPQEKLLAADIGTGSGAIAVALAKNSQWELLAVDIAEESLDIAMENSKRNGVEDRITFLQGDLLAPLKTKVDILVSNPPYIPSRDILDLDVQVRVHEPYRALDGGEDGLDFYRRICDGLNDVLKPGGMVAFEVGIHQARAVEQLILARGMFTETKVICDLAGIERVVIGL